MPQSRHGSVLLIGSLPFKTVQQVFQVAGPALAGYAARLPDGEAQGWVKYPGASLAKARGLKVSARVGQNRPDLPQFSLYELDGPAEAVRFAPVGYDHIALTSYEAFKQARAQGHIAPGTRFQVSLPTPFGVIGQFIVPEHVQQVLPVFEKHYLKEVETILARIPHDDLAVQWDVAVEIVNALHGHREGLRERVSIPYLAEAIVRAVEFIPADVEVGLHLCYGNPGGRHVIEPDDTGLMVEFSNEIVRQLRRPLAWIHMPVPKSRDDDDYFKPLAGLQIGETRLYLGLVHITDGEDGTRRRIDTARRYMGRFGVAYECGLRTFPEESIARMLELHKWAADYASAPN